MQKAIITILLPAILLLSRLAAGQAAPGSLDEQLILAASTGRAAQVQQLLEKGANIEAKDTFSGRTALIFSACDGQTELVKLLLQKGANIEAKDRFNRTALILASKEGKTDAVKVLLDNGANVEAENNVGETALLMASEQGNTDIAKMLLDKGANANAKSQAGYTALLMASEQGNTDIAKILLDKGTNVNATNGANETALYMAAARGNTSVVDLLLSRGADIKTGKELLIAASWGNTAAVKMLLDKGANIEAKDTISGKTALMWAASSGKSNTVKLLLERGAEVEAKDNVGKTALMWAQGYHETLEFIQEAISQNPKTELSEQFAELLAQLQDRPYDEARRENVIRLALSYPSLPPIPEEARQLALQASTLMKQTSNPKDMEQPIRLLKKALVIAPWWGNAYYNVSRAQELSGQYDEAVKQLNYYLELKPSEADAAEARAHIAVIQAEKQVADRKQLEDDSALAVKYVGGGTMRVRDVGSPHWWIPVNGDIGVFKLYIYSVPEEEPFLANVFRMPNNHLLAIMLVAQSNNGMYAGDQVGVYDVTENSCAEGNDFAFGAQDYTTPCGGRYYVKVSNQPNVTVTITYPATGASVTLPVALLYRGRALKGTGIFGGCSGTVHQGGARAMVLHFDCSVVKAAEDPTVNAAGLTPTTVKPE